MKLNPRTGTVETGMRKRPARVYTPARQVAAKSVQIDQDFLLAIERIGRVIGQQIADALQQQHTEVIHIPHAQIIDDTYVAPATTITVTPIEMDESIIDVGIGKTAALQKGEGSAVFAKKDVQSDDHLKTAKNKLIALKGRGS